MVKRKCGTCRHFKDGGIAGSGWCQHPARKDIQHMVLVRKTELACRNGWDQDLWEVGDQPLDIQPSTHIPMPISGGDGHEAPVIRAELPAGDQERAGEMFTDRITSISMPVRSQLRPGRSDLERFDDDAATADALDSRSSVREARRRRQEQRHLERKKHQETVLQRVDDLLDTSEPPAEVDRSMLRVRADDGPMTTDRKRDQEPPITRPQPEQRESSVPERQRPGRRASDHSTVEFSGTPSRFTDGYAAGNGGPPKGTTDTDSTKREPGRRREAHDRRNQRGETEPLPTDAVRAAVRTQREARSAPVAPAHEQPAEPVSDRRRERSATQRTELPRNLPPAVEPRPTTWFTGAGSAVPSPKTSDAAPPFEIDPIDQSRDVQTVRRCCATCRDFKQVGDGRTGWCNNPYAFRERRMVESSEIACRSSLGVWWLPHDDLWLERADTTHHGRPTPLLDELVGAAPAGRHGMGPRSS